jgi:5'-methylthioadenosine phosphorylase
MIETAKELNYSHHVNGTAVCIEGPRYSTKAESNLFRSWNASIVNMTVCPEVWAK